MTYKIYPYIQINPESGYYTWSYYFYPCPVGGKMFFPQKQKYFCSPISQKDLDENLVNQFKDAYYNDEFDKFLKKNGIPLSEFGSSFEIQFRFKFNVNKKILASNEVDQILNIDIK
jgi:hypothetical protein